MNEKAKAELDRIINVLADTDIVSQIFLFGSYARGDNSPDSDLDLCVLTTETDRHPMDVSVDLRIKISDIQTMPLDLFALNKDDFYIHAKRPTSFHHEIAENGILVYDNG